MTEVNDQDLQYIIDTAHRTRDMLELLAKEMETTRFSDVRTEDPVTLLKAAAEQLDEATRPFRYRHLRSQGVLTVQDLINVLKDLTPTEKAMPILMPKGIDDWQYIAGVYAVGNGDEYIMPTLFEAERPFDNRDA